MGMTAGAVAAGARSGRHEAERISGPTQRSRFFCGAKRKTPEVRTHPHDRCFGTSVTNADRAVRAPPVCRRRNARQRFDRAPYASPNPTLFRYASAHHARVGAMTRSCCAFFPETTRHSPSEHLRTAARDAHLRPRSRAPAYRSPLRAGRQSGRSRACARLREALPERCPRRQAARAVRARRWSESALKSRMKRQSWLEGIDRAAEPTWIAVNGRNE